VSNQPCTNLEQSLSADRAALELFQLAALLLSDESQAVAAVETAIRETEIDPCDDPEGARRVVRDRVIAASIHLVSAKGKETLAVPKGSSEFSSCLDGDDLTAAGISAAQLNDLVQGTGRARMREWLEQLPPAPRIVFVLRAISGLSGEQTATLLLENGGPSANDWTVEAVSGVFRQTLCSLTSLLVQSAQSVGVSD
jgi:hypothetical protein